MVLFDPFTTNLFVRTVFGYVTDLLDEQRLPKVSMCIWSAGRWS
jgi:hypothetical protein